MNSTTVAVDLAKSVFEHAVAGSDRRVSERRLTRTNFTPFFVKGPPCRIVMEARGSANHWAHKLVGSGHRLELLLAQNARAYVRRNRADRADATALVEAVRCGDVRLVRVEIAERQQIQSLHRLGTQMMASRLRCINRLRSIVRESGVNMSVDANVAKDQWPATIRTFR